MDSGTRIMRSSSTAARAARECSWRRAAAVSAVASPAAPPAAPASSGAPSTSWASSASCAVDTPSAVPAGAQRREGTACAAQEHVIQEYVPLDGCHDPGVWARWERGEAAAGSRINELRAPVLWRSQRQAWGSHTLSPRSDKGRKKASRGACRGLQHPGNRVQLFEQPGKDRRSWRSGPRQRALKQPP